MTDISTYEKIIDIYSKGDYPADALSNFYPHDFTIDGVACASMEGFLQSLKFASVKKQRKVCALSGIAAKKKGKRKFRWKLSGNVHWGGKNCRGRAKGFTRSFAVHTTHYTPTPRSPQHYMRQRTASSFIR